ncbi:hypothetical protein DDQ41_27145 [Streptomyces spongiicola]|uniref:Uncharacterized protein n=1 Tax=Streptomyces spongiicola TaxID=1690221 RepID=A0ABM6VCF0_9ACTN|nr:hypothetical protein DDQ41_27145 [Streptomyces spongiicola]
MVHGPVRTGPRRFRAAHGGGPLLPGGVRHRAVSAAGDPSGPARPGPARHRVGPGGAGTGGAGTGEAPVDRLAVLPVPGQAARWRPEARRLVTTRHPSSLAAEPLTGIVQSAAHLLVPPHGVLLPPGGV